MSRHADQSTPSFRVAYLREIWRRLAFQCADRPLAIYGAGRHTRFLLEQVRDVEPSPTIALIVDDAPARGISEVAGIAVHSPVNAAPSSVACVLVSSDSIEDVLTERARQWTQRCPEKDRPHIVRLYEGLPAGPYRGDTDHSMAYAGRIGLGAAGVGTVGDAGGNDPGYTAVTRIPATSPLAPGDDGLPVPPQELRAGYTMPDATYLKSGGAVADAIKGLLAEYGIDSAPGGWLRGIMEWGCSTGRVLRHWAPHARAGAEVLGCDVDAPAVEWGAVHLAPTLRVFQNTLVPSFPLADGSLDLVYAISVLTHIADHHDAWLMELRRIIRPGGWLFVTINDESVWARCAKDPEFHIARLCPRLDFSRPLEDDLVNHGMGVHAQSFWHTRAVRSRWSRFFEVVEIRPAMIDGVQTGVLLRR